MSTLPPALETVRTFYKAIEREEYVVARGMLADDLSFHSWFARLTGADPYIDVLKRLRGFAVKIAFHKVLAERDDVALFYDLTTRHGDVVTVAAWFRLVDGRISSVRIVCDPAPFKELWET